MKILGTTLQFLFEVSTEQDFNDGSWQPGPALLPTRTNSTGEELVYDTARRVRHLSARIEQILFTDSRRWRNEERHVIECVEFSAFSSRRHFIVAVHVKKMIENTSEDFVDQARASAIEVARLAILGPSAEGPFEIIRSYCLAFTVVETSPGLRPESRHREMREVVADALETFDMTVRSGPISSFDDGLDAALADGWLMEVNPRTLIAVRPNRALLILASDGEDLAGDMADLVQKSDEATLGPPMFERTRAQWHSIFLDTFLVGLLQRAGLNSIRNDFALVASRRANVEELVAMERQFAEFKAAAWHHRITEMETVNSALRSYQKQHGLDDLLGEVSRDLSQFSSQLQAVSAERSSIAVMLLTFVLVPLTSMVALCATLIPSESTWYVKALFFLGTIPASIVAGVILSELVPGTRGLIRSSVLRRQD